MFMRRRRPLARAAMVGGAAYYAGRKVQEGREQDAMTDARLEELEAREETTPRRVSGMSEGSIEQLKQLAELRAEGVLTEDEFAEQKRKLLQSS